ncbi:MAG TPA: serine protease [Phycisphaerales bacterium]|nr:serine protease [Phycisphaerales bacterium]
MTSCLPRMFGVASLALSAMIAPALRAQDGGQPTTRLAETAVFELTVTYDTDIVAQPIQPGFLVGPSGVGITSYNALHTARAAKARFLHQPDVYYKVELMTAEPGRDLALVKLSPMKEESPAIEVFLPLAPGELKDRQPVWTLISSSYPDEIKAKAGIADIVHEKLNPNPRINPQGQEEIEPFVAPGWIYSTLQQNRTHSGCPLVDDQGRLVGINVWSWPSAAARPVGLTQNSVDDLLKKYREETERAKAKGEGPPMMPITAARSKYREQKLIGSVFPRLNWPAVAGKGAEATALAGNFASSLTCNLCKGKGTITERGIIPKEKAGGRLRQGREEVRNKKCPECEGSKVIDAEKIWAKSARVARAIASLDPADEQHRKVLDKLAESAAEVHRLNGAEFSKRLKAQAREQLNPRSVQRGEAVMFIGALQAADLQNWDKEVERISVSWDNRAGLLAVAPACPQIDRGQQALFVGVVSGFVTGRRGDQWVVLERVSGVPLHAR